MAPSRTPNVQMCVSPSSVDDESGRGERILVPGNASMSAPLRVDEMSSSREEEPRVQGPQSRRLNRPVTITGPSESRQGEATAEDGHEGH